MARWSGKRSGLVLLKRSSAWCTSLPFLMSSGGGGQATICLEVSDQRVIAEKEIEEKQETSVTDFRVSYLAPVSSLFCQSTVY